jgi:aryl-alcohol dehydrogenase-like predicted oxidoreductase
LRQAVAAGIRMIDTAHLYAGGESEKAIGTALAPFPDDLTVATKGGYRPGEGRPERLREQLEQSFERLQTESIALYYLHRVDPETPVDESLGLLAEFQRDGRIGAIGLSEVSVEQIERACEIVPIAAVQNEYNLAERKWDDVIDHCAAEGIQFVPFYPLHLPSTPRLRETAARHGASQSQIALAWLLERSPAVHPIPGTLSIEHVRENLAAAELELGPEEYEALAMA